MSQYQPPQQTTPPQAPVQPYAAPSAYATPTPPAHPLAVTAMICGLVAPATWLFSGIPVLGMIIAVISPVAILLAIVFGHIALAQIAKSGSSGRGMALTGLIIGYVCLGLGLLFAILAVLVFGSLFGLIGFATAL
ncbi:DUF4190 domain-containing protein [Microbacterium suaedae]|uniref:DUF4190 domain-containing protein n=1 Tax=Microbacterium suaedae TaxID=2067813 RepID=UPI000DA1551B|nr:DUF4190 domain-containing protein [Microbacterium suaedae]